jgi:hypothetical protein
MHHFRKSELLAIESDGGVDIRDDVADLNRGHGSCSFRACNLLGPCHPDKILLDPRVVRQACEEPLVILWIQTRVPASVDPIACARAVPGSKPRWCSAPGRRKKRKTAICRPNSSAARPQEGNHGRRRLYLTARADRPIAIEFPGYPVVRLRPIEGIEFVEETVAALGSSTEADPVLP